MIFFPTFLNHEVLRMHAQHLPITRQFSGGHIMRTCAHATGCFYDISRSFLRNRNELFQRGERLCHKIDILCISKDAQTAYLSCVSVAHKNTQTKGVSVSFLSRIFRACTYRHTLIDRPDIGEGKRGRGWYRHRVFLDTYVRACMRT